MEFRVIARASDGEPVDEIMDGEDRELLRSHLEQAGFEVMSVRQIRRRDEDVVSEEIVMAVTNDDTYALVLTLIGGLLNGLALVFAIGGFMALHFPPRAIVLVAFGIFLLIGGLGCWILAAIRTILVVLTKARKKRD